ncbi:hypothetical protein HDU67_008525, partial [Dinochytrium kinnereticum]
VVFGEAPLVSTINPAPTNSTSTLLTNSFPSGSALLPQSTSTTLSNNPSNSANAINSSNASAPLSTPAVAGIALGVVAVLAVAGAVVLIYFRRRRSEMKAPIVGMPAAPLNHEPLAPPSTFIVVPSRAEQSFETPSSFVAVPSRAEQSFETPSSFIAVPSRAEQSFEKGVTGQSPLDAPPKKVQPPSHPNSSLFNEGIISAVIGGSVGAGKSEYGVKADEVESWTVEQVVGWLHRNRIDPLVLKSFQENSITGLSLLSLTEHHMEHSMGIHSLGDRLAISSLIATLRNDQPQAQPSSAPSWVTSEKAGGEEGRSTMVQLGNGSEKVMAPPPYENSGV